ncbi:nuclear transport factor 2 family protein [Limibaculum sp. M0105]|uniref:Nuclear transport factor 2 family protein n=1 Tax=Thermohalobaculum xanthum TaxID=2753746 RepID=A0A8J7M8Q3_9RHOB|nr:nuclear transport factor 2 family protein [Thermohalobaculum xanthum]MBK0400364.1 nuclear transport factor 2 family protein [Thermohalobaculum xanthum]
MRFETQLKGLIEDYLSAYAAHDAHGCAAVYAPDGVIMTPFEPIVTGRPAIQSVHRDWFDDSEREKRIDIVEYHSDGFYAHCLLHWSVIVDGPDGLPTQEGGCSLNILECRQGEWLITRTALIPDQ